jgi:hypothetical protein
MIDFNEKNLPATIIKEYNGWRIINEPKCFGLFRAFSYSLKTSFLTYSIENFSLYKTIYFVFQISFFLSAKNQKD